MQATVQMIQSMGVSRRDWGSAASKRAPSFTRSKTSLTSKISREMQTPRERNRPFRSVSNATSPWSPTEDLNAAPRGLQRGICPLRYRQNAALEAATLQLNLRCGVPSLNFLCNRRAAERLQVIVGLSPDGRRPRASLVGWFAPVLNFYVDPQGKHSPRRSQSTQSRPAENK